MVHAARTPTLGPSASSSRRTDESRHAATPGPDATATEDSPRMAAQRALSAALQHSPRAVAQRQSLDDCFGPARPDEAPSERTGRPNRTGLPDDLKAGIESLSGVSLDGARVHYHSSRPAQLQAHAFAQGREIHVAPGQERHLPHEAWHLVQQAQGRVAGVQRLADGVVANDDAALEHEADVMGAKALQHTGMPAPTGSAAADLPDRPGAPVQRTKVPVWGGEFEDQIYQADQGVDSVGASMLLFFRPRPALGQEGDTVSLVQTVKDTTKLEAPDGRDVTPRAKTSLLHERKLTEGPDVSAEEAGTGIDQEVLSDPDKGAQQEIVNRDPRYSEKRMDPDAPLRLKADSGGGSPRSTMRGEKDWPNPAALSDQPAQNVRNKDAGGGGKSVYRLTGGMRFEVAALHNQSRSYVGSVRWGWKTGADNQVELDPKVLTKVDDGNASPTLMKAARVWNDWKITDPRSGNAFDTMPLPTAGMARTHDKPAVAPWALETISQGYLRVYAPPELRPEDISPELRQIQEEFGDSAESKDGPPSGPFTAFEFPGEQKAQAELLLQKLNGL